MIKYLFKKWYYIVIALVLYIAFKMILNINLPILYCISLFYFMRIVDDIFDFEKDLGKRLDKKRLLVLSAIFSIIFIISNIYHFGVYGIYSILILGYIILMNKCDILKIFCFFINVLYLVIINSLWEVNGKEYLLLALLLSVIFYSIKRWKNGIR